MFLACFSLIVLMVMRAVSFLKEMQSCVRGDINPEIDEPRRGKIGSGMVLPLMFANTTWLWLTTNPYLDFATNPYLD